MLNYIKFIKRSMCFYNVDFTNEVPNYFFSVWRLKNPMRKVELPRQNRDGHQQRQRNGSGKDSMLFQRRLQLERHHCWTGQELCRIHKGRWWRRWRRKVFFDHARWHWSLSLYHHCRHCLGSHFLLLLFLLSQVMIFVGF